MAVDRTPKSSPHRVTDSDSMNLLFATLFACLHASRVLLDGSTADAVSGDRCSCCIKLDGQLDVLSTQTQCIFCRWLRMSAHNSTKVDDRMARRWSTRSFTSVDPSRKRINEHLAADDGPQYCSFVEFFWVLLSTQAWSHILINQALKVAGRAPTGMGPG